MAFPPEGQDALERQTTDAAKTLADFTPARVFVGRKGSGYPTPAELALRYDHAMARDAVLQDLDILKDLGADLVRRFSLFEVATEARTREEYLLRPDLGRRLTDAARALIVERCRPDPALEVVLGDGLSVPALAKQAPPLLDRLVTDAPSAGFDLGQPFVVRHARVGVMNDIGEALKPGVLVLLIGERPGLVTNDSLSAYMGFLPRRGHTDAERNLVSNIHLRGTPPALAAHRVLELASRMRDQQRSGVTLRL